MVIWKIKTIIKSTKIKEEKAIKTIIINLRRIMYLINRNGCINSWFNSFQVQSGE